MHFTKAMSSEMTSNYKCRKCLNIPWFALSVCSPSVAKSSSVKNGNALWAEKEEKNADVLFFGFISKDQAMWW